MVNVRTFIVASFLALVMPASAFAGEGATIIFRSGLVVLVDNGYKQILDGVLSLNNKSTDHKILQLNLEGGSSLINLAEVAIVCRDRCTGVEVIDSRDPARAKK